MGRNRSRKRNSRRILSNDIHNLPSTTRSGKRLKPLLSPKRKKSKKIRSNKKEEPIECEDTQHMTNSSPVIWEFFVPDKDSWSPYDQVQQDIFERMVYLGVNTVSLVHNEVKYVACLQTMKQRVFTDPLAGSEIGLRRRIKEQNKDTSLAIMSMEWLSILPMKYESSVNVYEITQEQSISAETSRAKIEYDFACSHFTRLINKESSGRSGPLSCHYIVTKVDTVVYDSDASPYCNYHLLKEKFVKKAFSKEILVFHGTTKDTIPLIITEGFKIGGGEDSNIKIKNGSSYGKGVYSSEHPGAAIQYGRGSGCVIVAKGLVTAYDFYDYRSENLDHYSDHSFSTIEVGDQSADQDSWSPEKEWVVFKDGRQLLPLYVIHFRENCMMSYPL